MSRHATTAALSGCMSVHASKRESRNGRYWAVIVSFVVVVFCGGGGGGGGVVCVFLLLFFGI